MLDEGVGLEDGLEPVARIASTISELGKLFEMSRDLTLVPHMEPAASLVLVPLAFASLLTGVLQSLTTSWGLFRHYWVLFKLLINVVATVLLLFYLGTFRSMAGVAADPSAELGAVRDPSPILHSLLASVLLLVATTLAVYKPQGTTPYGQRRLREQRKTSELRRDR